MYRATAIWDGQAQIVDIAVSDTDPLAKMNLLYGFKN
jgi:hypothetical protein